jgi:hypothetical protein
MPNENQFESGILLHLILVAEDSEQASEQAKRFAQWLMETIQTAGYVVEQTGEPAAQSFFAVTVVPLGYGVKLKDGTSEQYFKVFQIPQMHWPKDEC